MNDVQIELLKKLDDEFMEHSLKVKDLYLQRCNLFAEVLHGQGVDKKECKQKVLSEFKNMIVFMGKAEFMKLCITEHINKIYK